VVPTLHGEVGVLMAKPEKSEIIVYGWKNGKYQVLHRHPVMLQESRTDTGLQWEINPASSTIVLDGPLSVTKINFIPPKRFRDIYPEYPLTTSNLLRQVVAGETVTIILPSPLFSLKREGT
jgi:hypothetical protein